MRRRTFLTSLAAAVASPVAARAQQPAKAARIGMIMPTFTDRDSVERQLQPFRDGMRELGWEDGRNVAYDLRGAVDDPQRLAELAAGLVREKADLIVVLTVQMALVVRSVARGAPIVVVAAGDPVGTGAAASLARPGGTITGLSLMSPELAAKRVEQLVEIRPRAQRIAILQNPVAPAGPLMLESVLPAAKTLGLASRVFQISRPDEIERVFDEVAGWDADGVVVLDDGFFFVARTLLASAAAARKLPLACPFREMARAGCLLSYSAVMRERLYRAATYVDKILKGANPADLPFEQPTKFELVINLKTAKTLGIDVPATLLAVADEVIE